MKVFLSWSGENSRRVAEELRDWLESVIQALEPWFSHDDIEKGARWSPEITKELSQSQAGIVCVTPDNQDSSWLNFEAGAISNAAGVPRVCTFLVDMKPSDLKGPLTQFQATVADRLDARKLVGTLNRLLDSNKLSEIKLDSAFDAFWPQFENKLRELVKNFSVGYPSKPSRSNSEIIEETLGIVREMKNEQSMLASAIYSLNRAQSAPSKPLKMGGLIINDTSIPQLYRVGQGFESSPMTAGDAFEGFTSTSPISTTGFFYPQRPHEDEDSNQNERKDKDPRDK